MNLFSRFFPRLSLRRGSQTLGFVKGTDAKSIWPLLRARPSDLAMIGRPQDNHEDLSPGVKMTLGEQHAENPALANEIMAAAQARAAADVAIAERNRLKEIDGVSALYSDEMVQEAKYGETACTAQELAFRAAKEMAKQGKKALDDMMADARASGAQAIGISPTHDNSIPESQMTNDQRMALARQDVKALLRK